MVTAQTLVNAFKVYYKKGVMLMNYLEVIIICIRRERYCLLKSVERHGYIMNK